MKSPGAQCVILKLVARALRQPERGSSTISCILEILMRCFVLCSSSLKEGVELSILEIFMCSLCLSIALRISKITRFSPRFCSNLSKTLWICLRQVKNWPGIQRKILPSNICQTLSLWSNKLIFCLKWSKSVQMGPKLSKKSRLPFRNLLDPFGMFIGLPCLTIFVCFIGAFFWDTLYKKRELFPNILIWNNFSLKNGGKGANISNAVFKWDRPIVHWLKLFGPCCLAKLKIKTIKW